MQLSDVSAEWLTKALEAWGALERGRVARIGFDTETFNKGYVSNIATLKIEYSEDAKGTLPSSLFLKMSKPEVHPELLARGCHEVAFYRAAAGAERELAIPTIYEAECEAATSESHILMEDLAGTHFQRPLPIPPSVPHCEMIAESLGRVHAYWWESAELGATLGQRLEKVGADATLKRLRESFAPFADFLGDAILPSQQHALERILESDFLERRAARLMALERVTLIHGDAHTGNFMLPQDSERGRVVVIDWQLWDINAPTIDLAFLMALHWSPARRAWWEVPLLERYHQALTAGGVRNYGWEALWEDYRDAVIVMCLIPIGQYRRKSPAGVVWFGLQDSLAAFYDLHCEELL